ncbi:trypsin-like peptidase domain-containing protein [bacterium]|nr:trypsin-like peptidase domain-containing protein [bacterium]MBU1636370.1 trypsin-like peptidase domain-containing protein [bacterium]MBU1920473.1 trypsin-like peptidase domain-containing protein [bacterium]
MTKFLNAFLIGLIAGLGILYFYWRDGQQSALILELQNNLESLAQQTEELQQSTSDLPLVISEMEPTYLPPIQQDIYESRHNAITTAIAHTKDAVVGINVVQVREYANPLRSDPFFRMLFNDKMWPRTVKRSLTNIGSGFITTPDGYIVTNEHVVRDAVEITVTTTAGDKYEAEVIGTDPLLDMALLKINGENLPFITWANSEDAIVGEWVIAIGNPYGLFDVNDQPSVSVGVISALQRNFERDSDGRLYSDMIQTDAAINRGNSGGPLINAEGKALGMNTMIFSESGGSVGIGFAIPAHRIIASIDDLLRGGVNRDYWIGIRATDMTGIMWRKLGLTQNRGALVTSVDASSPAAEAGIQVWDVICEINGYPIDTSADAREYLRNNDLRVGQTITMSINRQGTYHDFVLELKPQPGSQTNLEG